MKKSMSFMLFWMLNISMSMQSFDQQAFIHRLPFFVTMAPLVCDMYIHTLFTLALAIHGSNDKFLSKNFIDDGKLKKCVATELKRHGAHPHLADKIECYRVRAGTFTLCHDRSVMLTNKLMGITPQFESELNLLEDNVSSKAATSDHLVDLNLAHQALHINKREPSRLLLYKCCMYGVSFLTASIISMCTKNYSINQSGLFLSAGLFGYGGYIFLSKQAHKNCFDMPDCKNNNLNARNKARSYFKENLFDMQLFGKK